MLGVLHLQLRGHGKLSLLLLMSRSVPKTTIGMQNPEKKETRINNDKIKEKHCR